MEPSSIETPLPNLSKSTRKKLAENYRKSDAYAKKVEASKVLTSTQLFEKVMGKVESFQLKLERSASTSALKFRPGSAFSHFTDTDSLFTTRSTFSVFQPDSGRPYHSNRPPVVQPFHLPSTDAPELDLPSPPALSSANSTARTLFTPRNTANALVQREEERLEPPGSANAIQAISTALDRIKLEKKEAKKKAKKHQPVTQGAAPWMGGVLLDGRIPEREGGKCSIDSRAVQQMWALKRDQRMAKREKEREREKLARRKEIKWLKQQKREREAEKNRRKELEELKLAEWYMAQNRQAQLERKALAADVAWKKQLAADFVERKRRQRRGPKRPTYIQRLPGSLQT